MTHKERMMITGAKTHATPAAVVEKARLTQQVEQLERMLNHCHETAVRLESCIARLMGAEPESTGSVADTSPPTCFEHHLEQVIVTADGLSSRLHRAAQRLSQAI